MKKLIFGLFLMSFSVLIYTILQMQIPSFIDKTVISPSDAVYLDALTRLGGVTVLKEIETIFIIGFAIALFGAFYEELISFSRFVKRLLKK